MADLYIDGQVLNAVRADLRNVRELAQRPGREMAQIDSSAVGSPALVARMDEFGQEWSYGIGKIADFSGSAADALDRLGQAFAEADKSLTDALNKAMAG